MVEFTDGSTIAQLSLPDMRLPIGYALGYPERIGTPFGRIDWATLDRLDFEPPDLDDVPLPRPRLPGRTGRRDRAGDWLSAANEVAVEAFLAGRIRWNQIADVCNEVLDRHDAVVPSTVDDVVAADRAARMVRP